MQTERYDTTIIGGGVAGLSAALFTARHSLDTLVVDSGESILRRNAHLENFPGFPAGVNARQLLDLLGEQADEAGCKRVEDTVVRVEKAGDGSGFTVETEAGGCYRTEYVVFGETRLTEDRIFESDEESVCHTVAFVGSDLESSRFAHRQDRPYPFVSDSVPLGSGDWGTV